MEKTIDSPSFPPRVNRLKRVLCDIVDLAVVALCGLVLNIPAILVFTQAIIIVDSAYQIMAVYLVCLFTGAAVILADLTIRSIIPLRHKGKTIGTSLFEGEIVTEDGKVPPLSALVKRGLGQGFLTYFTCGLFIIAEVVSIFFSENGHSFVDVISGTYIAQIPKEEKAL